MKENKNGINPWKHEANPLSRDFFRTFPEVIFEIDVNGNILFVNDKAFEIFECSKEDLEKGISIFDFIAEENLEIAKGNIKKFFEGKSDKTGNEYIVKAKSGKRYPVLIYNEPVINDNKIVGSKGIIVNISRLKKVEEDLRTVKSLAEQTYNVSQSAIFTVDNSRKITTWNKRAEEITGYNKDEVIGKNCFFRGNSGCERNCLLEPGSKQHSRPKECTIKTKKGNTRIILKYSNYIINNDGKKIGVIESFKDVTEEKLVMHELIKAKEKAEEADKLKSAFLANMSHDLRTPINGILGFADLLRDHSLAFSEREEYLNIIKSSGNQLLNLINDIIDISKIEANQLTIKEDILSINTLLEELQILFSKEIEETGKRIKLKLTKPLKNEDSEIYTDPARLQQILINLLSNAIKFTESGTIEFGYKIEGKHMTIYVADTGRGIKEEKIDYIFERFAQVDQEELDMFMGTGLGLAICKGLVNLLDGSIWVESKVGEGSTFFFKIPYIKIKSQKSKSQKIDNKMDYNWQDKTVLLVEDDPVNYKYMEILLHRTKAKVIQAPDGAKAVKIFEREKKIDLVLMDIQLPILNGYEATKKIKAMRSDIPVVAQTANAMSEDREKCLKAGCDDYIAKPISPDLLFRKLDKIFRMKKDIVFK